MSDRAAWLEERRSYVGASEIAAVCGISPYDTPRSVWLEKTTGIAKAETVPMRFGTFCEPFIAQEFQDYFGIKELREGETIRHPQFPFMAATPDRLWDSPDGLAVVELKTVGEFAAQNFGKPGTDQVPDHYLLQVGWQMFIVGTKVGYLAALVGNRELQVYRFEWNDTLQAIVAKAVEECIAFWRDHVEADVPPPLTGYETDTEIVKGSYQNTDHSLRQSDKAIEQIVDGWSELVKQREELELEISRRENLMREKIGEADGMETTVGTFTWKANKNGVRSLRKPFRSNVA